METRPDSSLNISIVIPTYNREHVLLETIKYLLDLDTQAAEIIVIDQSQSHEPATSEQLNLWQQLGAIKLIKLAQPSIPKAMNAGLLEAKQSIVLFLDDDIKPHPGLVTAHYQAHQESDHLIIAGKVIQPWDQNEKFVDDGHQFNSNVITTVNHFMGGNFSMHRKAAISIGGFDENFVAVAYRFEKEFADRWLSAGHQILFYPEAAIDHLKISTGGTRLYGDHLTTLKPHHAVGAYYYFLVSPRVKNKTKSVLSRLFHCVLTRHHLKRPWYIPNTLIAEIRGLLSARKLVKQGPKTIQAAREIS